MRLRHALVPVALSLAGAMLLLACGKRAPPLPPLIGSKPRVTDLELRQAGATVRARFTLPIRAGSTTIDYATKGIELWRRPVTENAAEISEPVRRPPPGPGGGSQQDASPGLPVGPFTKSATLAVSLSGDDVFEFLASPDPELVDRLPSELLGTELEYGLVLKSDIKSSGTVSDLARITPQPPPDPPASAVAELAPGGVQLRWTPAVDSAGAPLPVNIYRADQGREFSPEPLNEQPIAATPYEDRGVALGVTYRYAIRSVGKVEDATLESEATPEIVTTYRDAFAPAIPAGLRAFVDGSRITLLWTPNDERDLAGYHVWRRPPGGAWGKLTDAPLPSATYTDLTAPPRTRLEYAVSSVDRAQPPNESDRSVAVAAEGRPE